MPRLAPIGWEDLVQRLRDLGFGGPLRGAKHPYMVRGNVVVTIPNPHRGQIGIGLRKRVLDRAGVSRDEWLAHGM